MIIVKNIFKWIGVALLILLLAGTVISASLIAQTLFSGNLGKVIVGIVFFAYILFFSFSGSLMAFWVSYWTLPKWANILLIILILCGFVASLMLIPLVMNAGLQGILMLIPPALFLLAISRIFREAFLH